MAMRTYLLLLVLFPLVSCSLPGPMDDFMQDERESDEIFAPSEDNVVVVEAVLFVDAPLPSVQLRRTVAPGDPYSAAAAAMTEAHVSIVVGGAVYAYRPDPTAAGRYLPPEGAPTVEPGTIYELRVETEGEPLVRATTQTPPRMRVGEVVLLDDEREAGEYREVGRLRLFSETEDVYQAPENQLEYTQVIMEAHLEQDGEAASYQFGVTNLEPNSPLLIDSDWIEEEEFDRRETSPLLRSEDGAIYVPWEGIYFAGRHLIKLYAVDENWYDLVRTDNVGSEREGGEAGQGFQRPLFHVENGIGLFASACIDSFGFFVRPKGSPECNGCECWGCADSQWKGMLGLSGSGWVRYGKEVISGANCELSYEITGATTVAPCATCSFAWEFTLSHLDVQRDREGGCGEAAMLEGYTVRFAQGPVITGVDGDSPRHGLYSWEDDEEPGEGWDQVAGGWSMVAEEGQFAGRWLFGFPGD